MTTKAKGGRPEGKRNLTAVDRIRRDTEKMLDALHKRALTGDPVAVEVALRVGGFFDLVAVGDDGQS